MTDYIWSHPERRDLYLAGRILADSGRYDGDWTQWASDTLIYDLEIYNDPRQGVAFFLREDEVQLVDELGERLWRIVQPDPFSATALLAEANPSLQPLARKLVERIEANGRRIA
ncbi:hypothetical protein ACOYW6_12805 [Parablastomonas sp. CN1-191]|uniref:hypothetical protein n=1 Tax=Parablastomonas sp. CN1-191 TaxID=3400908 RepID=UPI003BF870B0